MSRRLFLIPLVLPWVLFGCTHVISGEARRAVDPEATFAAVKTDPSAHKGETLLLGGVVVSRETHREGSCLEIFRWKLDRWGEPVALDDEGGRFLVVAERFLDPVAYAPGRLVTLTGRVIGQKKGKVGPTDYTYPVFRLGEIYLWDTPFRYGIHPHPNPYVPYYIGPESPGRTHPYDPGYYYYPYTPYWLRPPP